MKYRGRVSQDTEVKPYWLSISDLMAGILVIFILFFVLKINSEVKLRKVFEEMFKVKEQIVSDLNIEFSNYDNISVLDDGTIRFFIEDKKSQWFKTGKKDLTKAGKKVVSEFVLKYIGILFSNKYIDYVDRIEVIGHTDSRGPKGANEKRSYLFNLKLSQGRAYSVVEHIHKSVSFSKDSKKNLEYKKKLRDKLTANGRSYVEILKKNNGNENKLLSRRVEFRFKLPYEKKYLAFRD